MRIHKIIAACAVAAWGLSAESIVPGDARRGEQLFQTEQCIQCHSVKGRGGNIAPDLGKRVDRDFTPAVMASLMWNHAPSMWAAMKSQNIEPPRLTPEQASDLFAYFVSARYFERRGDAARGKRIFAARHCAECHGIAASNAVGAPPVAKWESLADPAALAQQMWNHGARMREEFARKKLAYPQLTAQELTDMLVYLQNLPETKGLAENFQFTSTETGEKLFQSKGCAGCHTGRLALEGLLKNQTLTEIAVDMWNHQPKMKNPPPDLSQQEMRQILDYVWARQYFTGHGSVDRGQKVFAEKNCATCHNDPSTGAPKLGRGKDAWFAITIVAGLWQHGPKMLDLLQQKRLEWPRFTAQQMSDLIAYLNSL
ncbi:MAG TPA: c-type cytochrome [Bryobacteraceae bacterium]